jgi:hypothetical protein
MREGGTTIKPPPIDDETDAPAIAAEPALPSPGTPERDRLDARQREAVAGLLAATLQPRPSWRNLEPHRGG